jgi:hypothetical protein
MSFSTSNMNRYGRLLGLGLVAILTGCGSGDAANPTAAKTTNESTSMATARNILSIPDFEPLETGIYYIDPDADPDTPLRVVYRIAADGWSMWIGAAKFTEEGHVGVSSTTCATRVPLSSSSKELTRRRSRLGSATPRSRRRSTATDT